MIDLYTWGTPNGRKVSIMLEETGLEYESHAVNIGKDEQFEPDFLAMSPNNKIPAIRDRATGVSMMESAAILMYLGRKSGQLLAKEGSSVFWQTMEWLMWQMGGVGPMLGQAHHFVRFNQGVSEYAEERYLTEARRLYGVLDRRLGEKEYLVGDYSVADIATWPWISRYEWQTIDMSDYPNVRRWYLAIADRPAVQRGYDQPFHVNVIPRP
ncbi:MAG: glutathione S-transferase N-terminal domain-containing protein [Pseudomonadota bacterium]|nr:glutathione S-transferase N-terminal domain-containing protein [Pseudomonadota bacterium]